MNLPITRKEYEHLLQLLNKSGDSYRNLYNKLWSYKMNYLDKER